MTVIRPVSWVRAVMPVPSEREAVQLPLFHTESSSASSAVKTRPNRLCSMASPERLTESPVTETVYSASLRSLRFLPAFPPQIPTAPPMSGCTARKFPFPPCSPDRIAVPALSQAEPVQTAPARIRNLSPREHRTTKQPATSSTTISSYPVSPFRAPPVLGKSVLFIWNREQRHSIERGKTKRETRWGFPFMF